MPIRICHDEFVLNVVPFDSLTESDCCLWNSILGNNVDVRSPFLDFYFAKAVSEAMPGRVFVAVICDENGTIGYFPFQYTSRRLGFAEKVGGHISDYCGHVLPQRYSVPLDTLADSSGLNVFRFDHLPQGVRVSDDTDVETSAGLQIVIGDDHEGYFANLKANNPSFIKKVRRRERQITQELGPLRFEWRTQSPEDALANIINVKQQQYLRTNVSNALKEDWTKNLLANLLRYDHRKCHAVISTIFAGSTWVASHYGLCSPPVLHCWFPAYNPNLLRFGPGHILRFHMIAHAASEGIGVFDLGQGENPHKKEYIVSEYSLRKGVYRRPGFLGFADKAAQSLKWRTQTVSSVLSGFARRTASQIPV